MVANNKGLVGYTKGMIVQYIIPGCIYDIPLVTLTLPGKVRLYW